MRDSRDTNGARRADFDEAGRPIHRVGGRGRLARQVDKEYVEHWTDDRKIRKDMFLQLASPLMVGAQTEAEVARALQLADFAYQQIMLRESGRFDELAEDSAN